MRFKALVLLFVAFVTVLTACGDDDDSTVAGDDDTSSDAGDGDAATYTVRADARPDDTPMFFLAFFPNTLQAHPGDTISFEFADTGEPHTAGAGAVVDDVFAAIESSGFDLTGDAPPPPEVEAAFAKVPLMFPDGPPDHLNQGAAQPCYQASGDVPIEEPCTDQDVVDFDGTQALWNTGFVAGGESAEMKLADDIALGDYTIMCLVHGPEMTMDLTVVGADTEVPSADDVEAEGAEAMDAAFAEQQAGADAVRAITDPTKAAAGAGSETATVPGGAAVFPENIGIAAGEKVTWAIVGPHTVSFNAPESARPLVVTAADGTVSLNQEAGGPAGWEGPPPPPADAPPDGPPPPVDAGSWNGEGFHSSTILFDPQTYTLQIDTAGTYEYICLVHPDMEGTITVS